MRMLPLAFCALSFAGPACAQVTYSREISRLVQEKCQNCHRPGDVAPFAMMTYEDVNVWSADIQRVLQDRTMPPWKPVPGHGDFRDSYALSDGERQMFLDWIAAGMPEGDAADLPDAPAQNSEWELGDPDLVLQMAQPYTAPRGNDIYRCFVLPTGLDTDQFVTAVQVNPGNRAVVHHVILFIDPKGDSDKLEGQDGDPGYTCFGGAGFPLTIGGALSGWAPGARTRYLPDGIGVQLPAKARIVMQVHYFPSGRPGPDQTKVGLYFSKTPIEKRLFYVPVLNDRFTIPAGAENYQADARFTVPPLLDAHAVTIFPHMHLLGRKINVELENKGDITPMVFIDDWNFNWQGFYTYVDSIAMPAFSTLHLTCNFDNSANNPKNPNNPLVPVSWGEGTKDEMCVVFIGVTFDRENLLPFTSRRGR